MVNRIDQKVVDEELSANEELDKVVDYLFNEIIENKEHIIEENLVEVNYSEEIKKILDYYAQNEYLKYYIGGDEVQKSSYVYEKIATLGIRKELLATISYVARIIGKNDNKKPLEFDFRKENSFK